MGSMYKHFEAKDIKSARTRLNEAIPLTGSLTNGSVYGTDNIKTYAHGIFVSCYDYPYLSSSANQICDLSVGVGVNGDSYLSSSAWAAKKRNIYNMFSQVLVGHDADGDILRFDQDGDLVNAGTKYDDVFIIPFSRLLYKDEIKKGSFSLTLGIEEDYDGLGGGEGEGTAGMCDETITIEDEDAENDYRVNSPAGEYGILRVTDDTTAAPNDTETDADYDPRCGLIFYQAGIVVLSHDIFNAFDSVSNIHGKISSSGADCEMDSSGQTVTQLLRNGSIEDACDALRHRICRIDFNNTTELHSTIYTLRVDGFNHSSNPTYLSGSQIRTKRSRYDQDTVYFTGGELVAADGAVLAKFSVSEPIKHQASTDSKVIRVRLDY